MPLHFRATNQANCRLVRHTKCVALNNYLWKAAELAHFFLTTDMNIGHAASSTEFRGTSSYVQHNLTYFALKLRVPKFNAISCLGHEICLFQTQLFTAQLDHFLRIEN